MRRILACALAAPLVLCSPALAETQVWIGVDMSLDGQQWLPVVEFEGVPLAEDKFEHLLAGLALGWLARSVGAHGWQGFWLAAGAGLAKETRDTGIVPWMGRGDADWADLAWTAAGGAIAVGMQDLMDAP